MNKDAILATVIGFTVGLVVTGLVLFGPTLFKNMPKISFPKITLPLWKNGNPSPTPTIETPKSLVHDLVIDSPLPNAIEESASVLVSGTTSDGALVVLSTTTDDSVVTATADGKFAGKITVSEGKNTVSVTSFSKDKKQITKSVTIFYTPEKW
jgi:hypothetical protein